MAKKGQPAQLQTELNNDEEWEKFLQREGLLVVDVYADWCGPCLGMQATLKKIKLEFGGDLLQLAIAKSDGITALERFRGKSEPTWMFISKGKMIALMFGANAPQLRSLIIEEIKKEQAHLDGQPVERSPMEITELAEEERVRYETAEAKQREMREKEQRKKAKELLERRTKECENILNNLPHYGCVLIFPSAKDKYKEVLHDILEEAGLNINQTEKIHFDQHAIETLCFFTKVSEEFSEEDVEELLNNQSLMILLKVSSRAEIENIDNTILTIIYGHSKRPPGDPESPAQQLITHEEETEETAEIEKVGVWVPPTPQVRATVLSMFFPKISSDFTIPEPPPEPEHLAIIFGLDKKDEVLQVMQQYPKEVMRQGIFTKETPEDTLLVSKTFKKLEKVNPKDRTYEEKLVLQVSKQKSECILLFAQLEPLYMSPNAKQGKIECQKFFPDEFEPETEEQAEEELEREMLEQAEGEESREGEEGDISPGYRESEEGESSGGEATDITESAEDTHTPKESAGEITQAASISEAPTRLSSHQSQELPELPNVEQ